MFATIGKTIVTTLAVSAALDFLTKPRTDGSALGTGQSFGGYVRDIPACARDFIHGFVNGVRSKKQFAEHQ